MKTMSWTGSRGNAIELRARYTAAITDDIINADGHEVNVGTKTTVDARLELWVDGKLVDACTNVNFWRMIKAGNGVKKIWGLPIGMDEARASEVEAFLQGVIEAGKEAEVVQQEQDQAQQEQEAKVTEAQTIVERAANQNRVMTNAEYRAWRKQYNDTHNEGGEGYVLSMVTVEQLEAAKKILKEVPQVSTRYYSVTLYADMWEKEIPAAEVERLWQESESEHTGYTRDAHEIVMAVEGDPEKDEWDDEQVVQHMYRVGDTWYSIPQAYSNMQLNLVDEDDDN